MDSQQQHQLLPAKHVGSFLLLMFIATFRPTAIWPNFPISLEPVSVLAIGLLLFYKIYSTIGFKNFWQKYKVELILLAAYFSVCFISLYLNRFRYKDMHEIIRYGITFIVISMSFPAAIFLFLLPQNKTGISLSRFKYSGYLPWIYFALLAFMAIWQYVDFESAKSVGQFFVASEVWPEKNVNGFFRVSTDIAPVLSLIIIGITGQIYSRRLFRTEWIIYAILILLCLVSGVLVGSRVFLFSIACASALFFITCSSSIKNKLSTIVVIIVFFHALMMFANPTLIYKLKAFFPYLGPLYAGVPFYIGDFIIKMNIESTGRQELWEAASQLIQQNPLLGISNGGFRVSNAQLINVHNGVLQVLINSGFVGMSILFYLAYQLKHVFSLLVFVWLLSLLVDFPLDHSLPYIISLSFIFVMFNKVYRSYKVPKNSKKSMGMLSQKHILLGLFCVSLIVIIGMYYQRYFKALDLSLKQRLYKQIQARADNKQPIIINNHTVVEGNDMEYKSFPWHVFNVLTYPAHLCNYSYLNFKFKTNDIKDWLGVVTNSDCSASQKLISNGNTWVSNIGIYKKNSLWYFVGDVRFFSPVVVFDKGEFNLEFKAKAQTPFNELPRLKFKLIILGQRTLSKELTIGEDYHNYNVSFDIETATTGYLIISLENPMHNKKYNPDRMIYILPNSIKTYTRI